MSYTYLIGWSKLNKFYYGVRFAKNCKPEELWKTYKTSSKYVKAFANKNGDPDIIQVRKLFNNVEKARLWEHKVLKRMNVIRNDKFINKTDNKSIDPSCALKGIFHPNYGKKHSIDTIEKLKKPKSQTAKNNMRGKRPHVNQKGVNNNAFKGFITTPYGQFNSLHEAAAIENVNYSTIAYRIHNENFSDYIRVA